MTNGSAWRTLPLLLVLLLALPACRSLTGRTFGEYVDDKAISTRAKAALGALRPSPATRINVDTFGGTLYLSGVVASEGVKRQAEAIAWSIEGVGQVVNDLHVQEAAASASASSTGTHRAPAPAAQPSASLRAEVPGIARLTPLTPTATGAYSAYDRAGRLVATIYTLSARDAAERVFEAAGTASRPIDHVTIYPVASDPDMPEPHYYVILWHVSRAEAARLR